MNEAQKTAARGAFATWTEVADLTFIKVSDANISGVICLGTDNQEDVSAAHAYYPGRYGFSGDVYLDNDYSMNLNPNPATTSPAAALTGLYLPAVEDIYRDTLMSDNAHPSLGMKRLPAGPALFDIAPMHHLYLYGASGATRTDNDSSQFNGTISPVSRSTWTPAAPRPSTRERKPCPRSSRRSTARSARSARTDSPLGAEPH